MEPSDYDDLSISESGSDISNDGNFHQNEDSDEEYTAFRRERHEQYGFEPHALELVPSGSDEEMSYSQEEDDMDEDDRRKQDISIW